MKRCKTCKYWSAPWVDGGEGGCERHASSNGYANYPDTKAYAADPAAYMAGFYTMPDFGCTEWTSRIEWKDK
jgi:hypothetical protein